MINELKLNNRPLLTFALLGYNQECFISEAIEGAFSQKYSPLEIILSDDCSADGTFTVMREMTSSYKGQHHVILNRNSSNFGLGGHINRVMELSNGELIIVAAGDDISLPERANLVYEAWNYSGGAVTSIYSDYLVIDRSGALWNNSRDGGEQSRPVFEIQQGDLLEFITTGRPMVNGCTHAWSRTLFSDFGPLPANLRVEDVPLCFRSLAIAGILHINRPLIKYRRHDKNLSFHAADAALDRARSDAYDAKRGALLRKNVIVYDAIIHDIKTLRRMNKHNIAYLDQVEKEARRLRELCMLECQMISEKFFGRVRTFSRILSIGGPRLALKLAPQMLERRAYHKLRAIKRAARDFYTYQASFFDKSSQQKSG